MFLTLAFSLAEHSRVCAGNNDFSLIIGSMSFQIFLLVGHFTIWTRHNLLNDSTLKKIT